MLILSNQISKDSAKEKVSNVLKVEQSDINYFIKKLTLSEEFFEEYMHTKGVDHRYYGLSLDLYDNVAPFYRFMKKTFGLKWFKS